MNLRDLILHVLHVVLLIYFEDFLCTVFFVVADLCILGQTHLRFHF